MHYKLAIIDNNTWMYLDMAYQTITYLEKLGHTSEIVVFEEKEILPDDKYIFFGTHYWKHELPPDSIVTNFDDSRCLFGAISEKTAKTCEIWDYSRKNLSLLKEAYPEVKCKFFEMGYTPLLDYNLEYNEAEKDIDILLIGGIAPRRSVILSKLAEKYKIVCIYGIVGKERTGFISRSKICISIYTSELRECIAGSRFTPILCNNGFIITENCSDEYQNTRWSEFTVTADYDQLCDTVEKYLALPEERKRLADEFYEKFKRTRPQMTDV